MHRYILLLIVVAAGVIFLFQFRSTTYPGKSDFDSKKAELESIVRRISEMQMPREQPVFFTCDSHWDWLTLQRCDDNSNRLHYVSAVRLNNGRLVVSIITANLGHRGMYGYVYSSGTLAAPHEIGPNTWNGNETSIKVAADLEWWVEESLPDNWWAVSNRLN